MALRPAESRYIVNRPWTRYGDAPLALGLMTPRRKMASSAYYPGPKARRPLMGGKQPYWYVFDYTLDSRASGDAHIVTGKNFTLVAFMGDASQSKQGADTFRTQFYHVVDKHRGFRFSRVGENETNCVGTATDPFVLRRPYPMPAETSLQNLTQNRATAENMIQIVAYGLMD